MLHTCLNQHGLIRLKASSAVMQELAMNTVPGQSLLQQHRVLQLLLAWLEAFSVCAQTFIHLCAEFSGVTWMKVPSSWHYFFAIYNIFCLF